MKKHTAQWLFFTVLFALLPLFIFLIFSIVLNNPILNVMDKCCHELFFYSIMISATTINDLLHIDNTKRETTRFIVAFGFIILLLIASTSIYGMIVFSDNFIHENIISFHIDTMFVCSIIFVVFVTIISYLVIDWRYSE